MTFLSIVFALFAEQLRAFAARDVVSAPFAKGLAWLDHNLDAGGAHHGAVVWGLCVVVTVGFTALVQWATARFSPLLLLLINVAVLYLTMGFRQSSHRFSTIKRHLEAGDLDAARALANAEANAAGHPLSARELAQLAIEEALITSHRHVFAVLLWFSVLGAAGAVLYRVALYAHEHLQSTPHGATTIRDFAERAFGLIDWVPQRATAYAFAIVGNFEDAIFCWRSQAQAGPRWPDLNAAPIVTAGAGAAGVKLRDEIGSGNEPDVGALTSIHGLIWRALMVMLFVVFLTSFAVFVA